MNVKNLVIATIVTFTLAVGCEKAVKPKMHEQTHAVEIKELKSIVPIGDDDDERILIRPKVTLVSGGNAVGAEVHVTQSGFNIWGVISNTQDLELEVPEYGTYSYDIIYQGNQVVTSSVTVNTPIFDRTDIIQ